MQLRSLCAILLFLIGCDAVQPETSPLLVVEAFVTSGKALPEITLRRTSSLRAPYQLDASTAVTDAQVELAMHQLHIPYVSRGSGRYAPSDPIIAEPGSDLRLAVQWENQTITSQSQLPPPVSLDSVTIRISDTPVQGLLLDSVFIDPFLVDSLGLQALGAGAREGLVYLVEATLYWADSTHGDTWWMRTQLRPNLGQDRGLRDYFLSPEVLQSEAEIPFVRLGQRSWSGAYAVSVVRRTDRVPKHMLRVSLVRCTQAYADFVSGSSKPGEQEPPSNILGGVGIFAGLSIDTLSIPIR